MSKLPPVIHPEIPADETTVSWRSVGQLEDSVVFREWLEREFPDGASEITTPGEMETTRRSFLKLMGASTALAGFGMAACRRPEAYIVPYTKAPEWVIPGQATYYATAMPRAHGATPLVVTTHEGRPTKLAPNFLHPDVGGTDAIAQASVLDLYSPSRSRRVMHRGKPANLEHFKALLASIASDASSKIGFVYGADESPTRSRLTGELRKKFPAAKFYQYEALAADTTPAKGVRLVPQFAVADRILALDCDFAGTDPLGSATAFYDRRKPEGGTYQNTADAGSMNRLYVVESAYTLTGGMADHRLRVAPSQVAVVAAQIARGLGVDATLTTGFPEITDEGQRKWVAGMVADLKENSGRSAVLAGSRQMPQVHALALAINTALGAIGEGKPLIAVQTETADLGGLGELVADLDAGAIDTLFLLTPANPVYDAPADLDFPARLAKVRTSIHLGIRTCATAYASTWHIPAAHYLEAWSDTRTARGTYTLVQPMILPLYPDCVSELELLLAVLSEKGELIHGEAPEGGPSPALGAVRDTFVALGGDAGAGWKLALREGFFAGAVSAVAELSTPVMPAASAQVSVPTKDALEVIFATDASVWDGRWIDNAWLQEAPDPISKLTWDNAALIAPKTAKELGIYDQVVQLETRFASKSEDSEGENRRAPIIRIELNKTFLEIPVIIAFGQAENTIVLPLGYGQGFDKHDDLGRGPANSEHVGLVGINSGFNAYPLRTSATSYFATGAKVALTDKRYPVALTQEHHAMYGRALAREISTSTDKKKGTFEQQLANVAKQGNDSHAPPNISLYKPNNRKDEPFISDPLHQWAMAIDLSACSGCTACLVACQAENNIPVVGKEQVARGREMHWIRMDRYFAAQSDNDFDADNPAFLPQPVACQQCEMAPCETVCPVNATVHTEDGLNAMAYNRCIGTRYCANNCPYKIRRFNYFDYNKRNPLIEKNLYKGPFGVTQTGEGPHLQRNPNVTVRMRGVMEKCTYCVQRLKDAVIRQKRGHKQEVLASGKTSPEVQVTTKTLRIPVDSVRVACQEACPANAITFGNQLDDMAATVMRAKTAERSYDLLNYINTRPRTSYLARVKNPNKAMPDAPYIGKSTIHMA